MHVIVGKKDLVCEKFERNVNSSQFSVRTIKQTNLGEN